MIKTELENKAIHLLADLLFAYINKDEDNPHVFEIETVQEVVEILEKEYDGKKYNEDFFRRCKEHIKEKEKEK